VCAPWERCVRAVRTLCAHRVRAVNTLQQLLARCENVMDAIKTLWECRAEAVGTLWGRCVHAITDKFDIFRCFRWLIIQNKHIELISQKTKSIKVHVHFGRKWNLTWCTWSTQNGKNVYTGIGFSYRVNTDRGHSSRGKVKETVH